jgi:hypothetical protein
VTLYYDSRPQRYRAPDGRFVARKAVTDALESARKEGRNRVAKLTTDLKEGRINLAQWQISMRDNIKAQHLLHAGIAKGGKVQLSPSDLGRIGQLTRVQYEKLNNYARQIANGVKSPNVGRSKMYINAAYSTFVETEKRLKRDAGFTLARRVTTSKEGCSECAEIEDQGLMPIDELPPIGGQICLTNCLCIVECEKAA